ncbi:MAG: NAD(P)-dependent glycerol-3-phosphate dehydrogenase, partial [Lachnospiraceae bacterium]|nr:NAD(P)-dependent glycerol-3-phosphate dehydrogenase [Lachnospiraceae bacterium]
VMIWSIDKREVEMLSEYHEQKEKLPGVKLAASVLVTNDMEEAVKGRSLLVMAVPSPFVRTTARALAAFYQDGQIIVNVAKGIEEATLMTMTEIIEQEIPGAKVAVLSGPSHAEEVGRSIPTTIVAGAKEKVIANEIQDVFMNEVFRVYTSPDVTGIELGGSVKNVIALAAGVIDGLGYGDNTKAALMTRGIAELMRLANAMGGKLETIAGLAGIGDLIVTCTSNHSRNHNAGYLIGQGKTYQEAMDEVKMVVEGVYSAKAAKALAEKYNVSMPIVEAVNQVLFEGVNAKEATKALLNRERTMESEDMDW